MVFIVLYGKKCLYGKFAKECHQLMLPMTRTKLRKLFCYKKFPIGLFDECQLLVDEASFSEGER